MSEPAVSICRLTKVFPLHRRKVGTGLDTTRISAFTLLVKQALSPSNNHLSTPDTDSIRALLDINLDVFSGEVFGVIGRNGAGKSTLLKILARVLHPTSGKIRIRGRVASLLELGIGFAPDLSLRENIHLYARLAGLSAREVGRVEDTILEFAELTQYRDLELQACPSGSFIRLAFATLVSLQADVILADEVLAVGDSSYRQSCEERIRSVGKSGEAVLFVSHDMNAIRRTCGRVMWLDHGRVRMIGSTAEVVKAYEAELLSGHLLEHTNDTSLCRIVDLRLLSDDKAPIGTLQMNRPAILDCVFRVFAPEVAVEVVLELWEGHKHCVFSLRSPRTFQSPRPAALRAGLQIPAHFLNEGGYQAKCKLFVHSGDRPGNAPQLADSSSMEFRVFNTDPDQSVWSDWQWGRGGLLAPRLEWRQVPSTELHAIRAHETRPLE